MARKTYYARDMKDLARQLGDNIGRKLRKRLEKAIDNTLTKGVEIVKANVPVASGELRDSIHVEGREIVADAPHAWVVELGSMPHMPPVEPLIKWATLKGFENPEKAAWGIAINISKFGTKPTHFFRNSIPAIQRVLKKEMRKALGK